MKFNLIILFMAALVASLPLSLPLRASEGAEPDSIEQASLLAAGHSAEEGFSGGPGFKISMPELPTFQTRITDLGGQNLSWYVFKAEQAEELYVLAYTDLSTADVMGGGSGIVASIAENLLSETNLDALKNSSREVFLGIHPGREYLGVINDNIVAARLHIVGDRLYALFSRTDDIEAVDQFFSSFQAQPVWEMLTSSEGDFTVQTPVAAVAETYTSELAGKTLNWTAYRADNSSDSNSLTNPGSPNNLYVVAYADLPSSTLQQGADALLDQFSNRLLQRLSLEDELSGGRSIALAGHPGQERLGLESEQVVVTRLYLAGERLYVLFTMAESMADANQFLDSFQLQ